MVTMIALTSVVVRLAGCVEVCVVITALSVVALLATVAVGGGTELVVAFNDGTSSPTQTPFSHVPPS